MLESVKEIDISSIIGQIEMHIHKKNRTKINLNKSDFKQIKNGNNNFVFIVSKKDIKFVLRVSIIPNDLKKFQLQERILVYLENIDFILSPKVLYVGSFKGKNNYNYPFIIQELIPGKSLSYDGKAHKLHKEITRFLFKLHNELPTELFLEIQKELGKISWINFLKKFIIERIFFLEKYTKKDFSKIKNNLLQIIDKNINLLENVQMSFLHGDVFPPNFLMDDNEEKIVGVVDWDLMEIGDPAFEISSFKGIY